MRITVLITAGLLLAVLAAPASASTTTWKNTDNNGDWGDPNNWTNGVPDSPGARTTAVFDGTVAGPTACTWGYGVAHTNGDHNPPGNSMNALNITGDVNIAIDVGGYTGSWFQGAVTDSAAGYSYIGFWGSFGSSNNITLSNGANLGVNNMGFGTLTVADASTCTWTNWNSNGLGGTINTNGLGSSAAGSNLDLVLERGTGNGNGSYSDGTYWGYNGAGIHATGITIMTPNNYLTIGAGVSTFTGTFSDVSMRVTAGVSSTPVLNFTGDTWTKTTPAASLTAPSVGNYVGSGLTGTGFTANTCFLLLAAGDGLTTIQGGTLNWTGNIGTTNNYDSGHKADLALDGVNLTTKYLKMVGDLSFTTTHSGNQSTLNMAITGANDVAGTDYSQINVIKGSPTYWGQLTGLGNANLVIDITPGLALSGQTFTIITSGDGATMSSQSFNSVTWVGGTGNISYNSDGSVTLTGVVAAPEPATIGLLVIGGLGVLIRRRK